MSVKYILFTFLFGTTNLLCGRLDAQCVSQVAKATASDRAISDSYGWSVASSGNFALVGSRYEDQDELGNNTLNGAGSAYILQRSSSSGSWVEIQKIVASDREAGDEFGSSVAIHSTLAVVGVPKESSDVNGQNVIHYAGSVYIYEYNSTSGSWSEIQKIVASDRSNSLGFGTSVSVSQNTILVGSRRSKAYFFEKDSLGVWMEVSKLKSPSLTLDDLVVSVNGDQAIVGSPFDRTDENGGNSMVAAGAAFLVEKDNNGIWNPVQKIVASSREFNGFFGKAVDIQDNIAVIGSPREDFMDVSNVFDVGSVYVFERNSTGQWIEIDKLMASDKEQSDQFGVSVGLDNGYIIVGAEFEDHDVDGQNFVSSAGSAYVFEQSDTNGWNQLQKITAGDRGGISSDRFGGAVAISFPNTIVGAFSDDDNAFGSGVKFNAGSAYLFDICNLACETPTNLASIPASQSATISWGSVQGAQSYTIRGERLNTDSKFVTLTVTDTFFVANGLSESTFYFWQVRANCPAANSDYSPIKLFQTNALQCEAPQSLSSVNITGSTATLQWDHVPAAVNYVVRGSEGSFDKSQLVFLTTASSSINVSGLNPGSSYFWQVQSICNNTPTPQSVFTAVNIFTTNSASNKLSYDTDFSIFPNPAIDQFEIELPESQESETVKYSIYSLQGKTLQTGSVTEIIEVKNFEMGVYLVEVEGYGLLRLLLVD